MPFRRENCGNSAATAGGHCRCPRQPMRQADVPCAMRIAAEEEVAPPSSMAPISGGLVQSRYGDPATEKFPFRVSLFPLSINP